MLSSYRWRRRLAWSGAWLAAAATVTLLVVLLPKGGEKHPGVRPGKPVDVSVAPAQVQVTSVQKRAVNETLVAFIRTGVTRDDPAAAWNFVTPALRAGISRSEWNSGQLPVTPYPAQVPKLPEWNVISSYKGDLTIDLLLQPRRGAKRGPIAFAVELKRTRNRWLIDSIAPEQVFSAPSTPAKQPPSATGLPKKPNYPKGKLSPLWFIVPGSLLGLALLVPATIVLFTWRRNRAIERRYRKSRTP